jgi:hypothetical protein
MKMQANYFLILATAVAYAAAVCTQHSDCFNDGGCVGNECVCQDGSVGSLCETDLDDCNPDPCLNGGTCADTGLVQYQCTCPPFATGPACETFVSCDPNPCLNGGMCTGGTTVDPFSFSCACLEGTVGVTCETAVNNCDPNPCLNAGTCTNTGLTSFECSCLEIAEGPLCETRVSPWWMYWMDRDDPSAGCVDLSRTRPNGAFCYNMNGFPCQSGFCKAVPWEERTPEAVAIGNRVGICTEMGPGEKFYCDIFGWATEYDTDGGTSTCASKPGNCCSSDSHCWMPGREIDLYDLRDNWVAQMCNPDTWTCQNAFGLGGPQGCIS